jgi:hypothetical protein
MRSGYAFASSQNKLTREFMTKASNEDDDANDTIDTIQSYVAPADTGGIPSLISMVVDRERITTLGYGSRLSKNISSYLLKTILSSRLQHLFHLYLARPKVSRESVIVDNYTG